MIDTVQTPAHFPSQEIDERRKPAILRAETAVEKLKSRYLGHCDKKGMMPVLWTGITKTAPLLFFKEGWQTKSDGVVYRMRNDPKLLKMFRRKRGHGRARDLFLTTENFFHRKGAKHAKKRD